jgi:hypothetical protein
MNWGGEIVRAISDSKVMVLVFSSEANRSQQILREVERAVSRNVIVVPFRIENIEPGADLEYYISAHHWLDALTPPLEQHIDKLVATVTRLLRGPEPPEHRIPGAATPASAGKMPPRPFTEATPQPAVAARRWSRLRAPLAMLAGVLVVGTIAMVSERNGASDGSPDVFCAVAAQMSALKDESPVNDSASRAISRRWESLFREMERTAPDAIKDDLTAMGTIYRSSLGRTPSSDEEARYGEARSRVYDYVSTTCAVQVDL